MEERVVRVRKRQDGEKGIGGWKNERRTRGR